MIVAPLVGAWIEIQNLRQMDLRNKVAPLVGAWIEIIRDKVEDMLGVVAPLVGAWIEIDCDCPVRTDHKSLLL